MGMRPTGGNGMHSLTAATIAGLFSAAALAQCPGTDDVLRQVHYDDVGAPAKASVTVQWTEFDPIVILPTRSPASPVVFRAQAQGGPQSLRLEYSGGGGGFLTLLDNGVAPDTVAGDQIFAANLPTPEILSR